MSTERAPDGSGDHGDHPAADSGHGGAHDKHAGHSIAMFRDRFWLSLLLTLPVVFFSEMIQEWFGYTAPTFPGSDWVAPVLGTFIFVYGGSPFLKGAVGELRDRQPGMMLLIGMAIVVAFVASAATTFGWFDLEFWWELAALITIMLLGHWMEMRAIGQARGALAALAELLPDEAERITGGETETVSVAELKVGDLVLVRPGGRVPADGVIAEGEVEIDESMVTGESKPVAKTPGDRVVAGTVATDSAIRIEIDAVGEDTALAGIQRLVALAQDSKSRAQVLADRAAAILFYVAVAAAVITVITWLIVEQPDQAIVRTVAVLVIACPHALGLAIPLVIAISTSMAARNGILVKDRLALERMRSVDIVLFDKTGTLTKGSHRVSAVTAVDGDQAGLLAVTAAVESDSEHPLARAIVTAARDQGDVPIATEFRSMSGRGVEASVDGARVAVGGPALLRERDLDVPPVVGESTEGWIQRGAAVLYVISDGSVVGALSLEDEIRPESRAAVDQLHQLGVQVAMITGDARQVAEAVGSELDIDEVLAEVLPEDKHSKVAELQQRGLKVAMVGDGVNDAPALAQADVGIAIGAGTDVAIESAGIVLASDDPRGVVGIRRLSQAGYRKMVQNLVWAAGYNVAAIPLAAGALAWAGIVLAPAAAAVLMSASTVIVAINAQLLRRVDLRPV
ncbi:MAG TPA: copper-translocating P-type ATPase [Acidimicrobiia bacterium]|nr:copper-translocating P-type ATPase [Acidimicrobiia bacterium]